MAHGPESVRGAILSQCVSFGLSCPYLGGQNSWGMESKLGTLKGEEGPQPSCLPTQGDLPPLSTMTITTLFS